MFVWVGGRRCSVLMSFHQNEFDLLVDGWIVDFN